MDPEKFYSQLYARDGNYGKGGNHEARSVAAIEKKYGKGAPLRILDIGCGRGDLLEGILQKLKHAGHANVKAVGMNISDRALQEAQEKGIETHMADIDGKPLPFGNDEFDAVLCFHVLEHIIYTDELIGECRRVMKKGGVFIVETPNVAWYANRVVLALGMPPIGIECSARKTNYGVWRGPLKEHIGKFDVAGHVRAFTLGSLKDNARENGLKIVGEYGTDRFFGLVPSFARNIGLVLTK